MEQNKVKNPHRIQAISWRNGAEKEEVVEILNSPEIDKYIPDSMKWYQGHNSAGKRVLWACREIKRLGKLGYLEETKPLFGKPEEVENLEKRIEELENMLKHALGGEVNYIETINKQSTLIRFYSRILNTLGITVDEEHSRFRTDKDHIWHLPII